MNCNEVTEHLAELLYDEIDDNRRHAIETHLAGCEACSSEYASLMDTKRVLNAWTPAPHASLEVARPARRPHETAARPDRRKSERTARRWSAISGAAAVMAMGALLLWLADTQYANGRFTIALSRETSPREKPEDEAMSQYLLLLYDRPGGGESPSPEQIQLVVQEYIDWSADVRAAGKMVAGQKLTDDAGRVLRGSADGVTVAEGVTQSDGEVLGGYFLINADSYDQAVAVARTCPHVAKYNERIDIRRVE